MTASIGSWRLAALLLPLLLLLLPAGSTEARPSILPDAAAASAACGVSCPPAPHWRGFQPGRLYRYRFEHGLELATDLASAGTGGGTVNSSGVFEVLALTDCELAVSVTELNGNTTVGEGGAGAPRTAPDRTERALRRPLRVWHREGRFEQLCPSVGDGEDDAGETRESLNLKRALLSQLQVTPGQRGRRHQLEERDILGDCWTEYTPESLHTLLKTKDLASCRLLAFEAYPFQGVKGFADERVQASRPVSVGSLACRLELDAKRDLPRSVDCNEQREVANGEARLITLTKLRLLGDVDAPEEPAQQRTRPYRRTDLRQEHRSSVECQQSVSPFDAGSECLERAATRGVSAQDEARRLVAELCREATPQYLDRETPGKFAELVGQLRRMDSQVEINRIYQWLLRGYCSSNPSLKPIVRSAIAAAGTRAAVKLILQQILSERNSWSVDVLGQLPHPTSEMLQDVLEFVERRRSRGSWQAEALALGDLVYRVCRERPDCASDPAVARVVSFFSNRLNLAEACSRLEAGSSDLDDAFVSLLAAGNMGRVDGGASALVACANNSRLALAHRVFALQSLRRFETLRQRDALDRLIRLMLDGAQDAELRIAAYQALMPLGLVGRFRSAIQKLLTNKDEDRQTQMFVRTHLTGLAAGSADPLLEKETVATAAKLLREASTEAPRVWEDLDRLSWRQYSSAWRVQHFSQDWATGGRVEAAVVFSAHSAIPRYVGLNLTLIDPGRGRWINALEVGLRIEGVDDQAHEAYRLFTEQFGASKTPGMDIRRRRVRRQTVGVDLTPEQEARSQLALEPRLDILVRQSGSQISHSALTGIRLTAPLQLLKNIDFSTVKQLMELLPQFKKFFDNRKPLMSAGVLSEEAISLPTISGAPLVVKNEAHYLAELRLDKVLDLSWTGNSSARLELRPVAALRHSRTVAVDALFERLGVRTNSSFVTNTALRFSLQKDRFDSAGSDEAFSVKLEPLGKRQSMADAKADVALFWHSANSESGKRRPVEKPLVPTTSLKESLRCTDSFVKTHTGLKLCLKSEQISSSASIGKLIQSLRRRPGSFRLYLEKDDNFGAFEIYFRLKRPTSADGANRRLELLIGDRNSPDRMIKLALKSSRSGADSSWRFELINPVFPVSLNARVTNSPGLSQMQADVRIGSVEYKAESSASWETAASPLLLTGSFYRKDKVRQRLEVSLSHKMDGRALLLLPQGRTAFNLTTQSGNQLRLVYQLYSAAPNFTWEMSSEYRSATRSLHSVKYRLKYENTFNGSLRDYGAIIYDLEVRNSTGPSIIHSLHAKLRRSINATSQANVLVLHQLRLGPTERRSPLDFDLQVSLRETIDGVKFSAEGSGELKYFRQGTEKELVAKLEGLKVSMGESTTIDGDAGSVGRQFLYAIDCGLAYEDYEANYKGVLRYLPIDEWQWLRQAFEVQLGAQLVNNRTRSEATHFWHLKNYVNRREPASWQILRMIHGGETLVHINHKLQRDSGKEAMTHGLLVQSKINSGFKLQSGVSWVQEGIMKINTSMDFGSSRIFKSQQKFEYTGLEEEHKLHHRAELLLLEKIYVLESDMRLSRATSASLFSFLQYQSRILTGRYNIRYSLSLFLRFLISMRFKETSMLTGPEPDRLTVLQNVIDLMQTNGTVWKNQLRARIGSVEVFNYGLSLVRRSDDAVRDSPRLRVVQLEAFGMGHSLKSQVEARMRGRRSQAEFIFNVTSSDTWGWHRVKADTAVLLKGQLKHFWRDAGPDPMTSLLNFDTKLSGHVFKRSIDSNGSFSLQKDFNNMGRLFQLTKFISTPGSRATFKLWLNRTSESLQLTNLLTNSFSFLPFEQLGSTTEFQRTIGTPYASLTSKIEVHNSNVASAKALHSPTVSLVDVRTKHPRFQEVGLKVGREKTAKRPGETNVSTVARFNAFGWNIGAKQSGLIIANTDPARYKRLMAMKSDIELTGLESYIEQNRFSGEGLFKLKHSNEFNLLFLVAKPNRDGRESSLIRLSSNFELSPLLAELKLRTKSSSGRELSYGARLEFDRKRKANADVEFGERRAELSWSQEPSGSASRSVQFLARNSFLVSEPVFIGGIVNSTWPLKVEPLEVSMDIRLSSSRLPGVSVNLLNHLERKLALLSIHRPSDTAMELVRLSYNQSSNYEGIRGVALAKFDFSPFLSSFESRSLRADYLFGPNKELNFAASRASVETHTGNILWYSSPQPQTLVRGLTEADFVVAIKSLRSWSIYLARSPIAASQFTDWRFMIERIGEANRPSTQFSAMAEISDAWNIRSGQVKIYDKEFELKMHPEGGIELVVKSGKPMLYRALWSMSSSDSSNKLELKIQVDDSTAVAELVTRPGEATLKYGNSDAANFLSAAYTLGDSLELTVSHQVSQQNFRAQILPGIFVSLPQTPFNLTVHNQGGVKGSFKLNLESSTAGRLNYTHNLRGRPQSLSAGAQMTGPSGEMLWELSADLERSNRKVDIQTRVLSAFEFILGEQLLKLRSDEVIDFSIGFPSFRPSGVDRGGAKSVSLNFSMPLIGMRRSLELAAQHQLVEKGRKLLFSYGRGGTEMLNGFLTAKKTSDQGVSIDLEAQLSSNVGLLWSATNLRTLVSAGMQQGQKDYKLLFNHRVIVDGADTSVIEARIIGRSGRWPSWPSEGRATATGFSEWEANFDLSQSDGSKSVGARLVKFGSTLDGSYSINASLNGRDFRFEAENPQRHFVVAKELDPSLSRRSLTFFLNKRLSHGLVIAFQQTPRPRLQLELPTRLIQVDFQTLQEPSTGSRGLELLLAWDFRRSPDKYIRLELRTNFSREGSGGAAAWVASASCEAPFLRDRLMLELRREVAPGNAGGSALVLRQLASDREVARVRVGYEQQLGRVDLLLETREDEGTSSRLSVVVRMSNYSEAGGSLRRLFLGDVRIEVPSQMVNKSFKFVYRPMREFTCAGASGSSISLKFSPNGRFDRFTVFASGNDRQAARLDAVLDRPKSRLTATLNTGVGGFDWSVDLRGGTGGGGGPGFRPNATLVFASAGVSEDGRLANAAVLIGRMRVGRWPDPTRPASVPRDLNLFSVGLRLHSNNTVEYSSAWRSERADGVKSAVAHLKESLLDTWTASGLRELGSSINALLAASGRRMLDAVDVKQLAEELKNPLLADLAALKLFAESAVTSVGNNPRLAAAVRLIQRFGRAAERRIASLTDSTLQALSAAQPFASLVNLSLADRVQRAADATVEFIDSLPLLAAWRSGLDACKSAAGVFADGFAMCLESADAFLRRLLRASANAVAPGTEAASVVRLLYERAGQLVTLGAAKERAAKALQQIELALLGAVADSLKLLLEDLQPFAIGHLGDLVRLKDWLDDLLYELRNWIDFGVGANSAARDEQRSLGSRSLWLASLLTGPESLAYWRRVGEAWRLLGDGKFADGVRKLLMTDAYVLRVWRPVCNATCRTSRAPFASVSGIVYSPIYLDSLSPQVWRHRLARLRSIRSSARRLRDRVFATSSDGYVLLSVFNDWRQMESGLWDPAVRLLAMRHRTAVLAGGNSLVTFDGVSLSNLPPCSYILAHDFRLNEFTVAQSYRPVNGSSAAVRQDLLIRFGSVQYSVSPDGVLRINGRIEKLPMRRYVGGRLVEAERFRSRLLVRFHGETLRNTLLLRCNSVTDSCLLRVHPLYQARVDGMAGSNDGHHANDLQGGSRDSHVRFWTSAKQCLAATSNQSEWNEAVDSATTNEAPARCRLWFSQGGSSFDKCFSTVSPRPYLSMCLHYAKLGKDVCEVAVQYTDRCRNELVNINTPYRCVRCQLDEETSIAKDDLVSEPRILRKRLQAVFLLENSECVGSAIGLRGSYVSYLANLIDRVKISYPDVKTVEFGLAHYGGQGGPSLKAYPIHDTSGRFGSLPDLNAGLVKVRLNGTSVEQFDVLKALAALQNQYAWEPLAQKHVFLFSCQTCTARSWDYAKAFDEAFKSISSEIFLHVLTKHGIPRPSRTNDWLQNLIGYDRRQTFYSDRRPEPIGGLAALNPSGDCSAELAMDSQNQASGTVWHLDKFGASRADSVRLSRQIFAWLKASLSQPQCQRCSCALSDSLVGRPRCHAASCEVE